MIVTLSWFEMYHASALGVMRQIEALKNGRKDAYGYAGDGWAINIRGALAECALAKAQGLYWEAVVKRPHDLPGDVSDQHVRSTTHADGCLIIHPGDPDDGTFWLVLTHQPPKFTVVGSINGRNAKRPEWWRENTGRPAYFVPQTELS